MPLPSRIVSKKEEGDIGAKDVNSQLSTEEEVKILKQELAQKQKELESFKAREVEGEKVREESKEKEIEDEKERIRISPEVPSKIALPPKISKPKKIKKTSINEVAQDLKEIMSMDKPKQVKTLVYLSFEKGVNYAANIARKLKDPYLLDEFHDTLVDNLYDLLKKKKKI